MHFHAMAGLALAFFSLSLAKDIDPKVAKDPDSQARTPLAKRQAAEKPISISYLRGILSVAAYETQEETKRANTDGIKARYAFLWLRPLPDKDAYDKILALTGIQPLGRTYFEANGQIYEQWKIPTGSLGLGKMARVLVKEVPEFFFNLIPIDSDWKLSPKMAGLRDFKKEERQEETGKVCGAVYFFADIPKTRQSDLLSQYLPPRQADDKCHYAYRSDFAGMADLEEVEYVIERDTVSPITNDRTRSLINVTTLTQPFPTHQTTPRVNWLDTGTYASNYYGRNVIVGVYDTGIDTAGNTATISDFREQDGANRNQVRRGLRNTITNWSPFAAHDDPPIQALNWQAAHGSHVAGIIGGNGWNSRMSGAPTNFLWRGIAPRVQFFSQNVAEVNWPGFAGHVNNHSHVSDWGNYDAMDASIDQVIQNHATTHTMVYAAANSGLSAGNTRTPQGYYSILANAKNPITVGASYNDTLLRARFSSMGPTRDGRIKPDIMAPGASFNYPN